MFDVVESDLWESEDERIAVWWLKKVVKMYFIDAVLFYHYEEV